MLEYPNGCKDNASPRKIQEFDEETSSSSAIQLSSLYENSNLCIESAEKIGDQYHLYGRSSTQYGICPYCGTASHRVHSRYFRTITDLPVLGSGVIIHFQARKFFCEGESCPHKTFAEQPGNEVFRYRRRTRRCELLVARQGSACSSNQAKRLLSAMNIPLSSGTILRDMHRISVPDVSSVRKIGVDDWAFRKGVTYGSIVVNLENGTFLTLLSDRECDSFRNWLDLHPNISVVSRDRSSDYSAAIASTQRDIIEVADRFHLIKNLSDKISKLINERFADYKKLIRPEIVKISEDKASKKPLLLPVSKRVDKRQVHFDAVKKMRAKGISIEKIAKSVGISKPTVIKYIGLEALPQRGHSARNAYHLYEDRVSTEYLEEGISLQRIWEKLVSEGAKFGSSAFYEHFKYLTKIKQGISRANLDDKTTRVIEEAKAPLLSPIVMSVITDKYIRGKDLTPEEAEFIATMRKLSWFIEICAAAKEFYEIVNKSDILKLRSWIEHYKDSSISYLKSFIYGLRHDMAAVENALRYPISNGILEGYVNKLKTIKRSMYGRAGIELLAVKMYLAEGVLFN